MAEKLESGAPNLPLPKPFLDFLSQNGLDPSIYVASEPIPRYVRLKPGCEAQIAEIEAEVKYKPKKVHWLPNFYYLPPDARIASTKLYQEGKIYGIDAASGAAVIALNISPEDHVLDLCAAPGAKLCMMAEMIGSTGSVTGVDVARHRLAATRTMLQKYALGDQCRLFVADGTRFSLIPLRVPSNAPYDEIQLGNPEVEENLEVFKEWTPHRPWKERKRIAKARESPYRETLSQIDNPDLIFYGCRSGIVGLNKHVIYRKVNDIEILQLGYDKVLVDAECTHDGSIKHIQKFAQWGWTTLPNRVLDADRTEDLTLLQLNLLTNGFRLLKAGGYLVYSTCSLTVAQNEDVVEQFLSRHFSAVLVEIEGTQNWPCRKGRLPKTIRFDPMTSSTSGLFVAKFTKKAA